MLMLLPLPLARAITQALPRLLYFSSALVQSGTERREVLSILGFDRWMMEKSARLPYLQGLKARDHTQEFSLETRHSRSSESVYLSGKIARSFGESFAVEVLPELFEDKARRSAQVSAGHEGKERDWLSLCQRTSPW